VLKPPSLRRGATLVELIVTAAIGGIVLTLLTLVCLRQQRVFLDLSSQAASYSQLRDAESILPIDLRGASAVLADIREARDTSIELRGTILSAIVCDTASNALVLSPARSGAATFAGILSPAAVGDTAWLLTPGDSSEAWIPYRVASVGAYRAGGCSPLGPLLLDSARLAPRTTIGLDGAPLAASIGSALRVTRPLRYSLYRGSDNLWYLGQRDWNVVSQRFNGIQPVAGPLMPPVASGLALHYYDSVSTALATPVADPRLIASIRVDLKSAAATPTRALASAARAGPRVDSASVWVLLRNRR